MTDTPFASWLLYQVSLEHDNMNREYFDKGTVGTYPYFYMLRDVFARIVKDEPISCLDVGCGAGWQAKWLDMCGFKLVYEGLDISPHMCERAKTNYPTGTFHVADILGFEPGRTWDIVMACGSIEHFADWKAFLSRLAGLSSRWVVVHKVFFTVNNAPTNVFERTMYQGLKEIRVVMNYGEFATTMFNLGFDVDHRYDWSNGSVSGVVARRRV